MPTKILIISAPGINRFEVADRIVSKNDDLSIADIFISDEDIASQNEHMYYMPTEVVNLAYKNKCLLYITTENYISYGVTMDSMYNNSIFCMDFHSFNDITDHVLLNQDIIIVWLDSKHIDYSDDEVIKETKELSYVETRLEYVPYMYFLDEDPNDVADTILEYISATESERIKIIENNQ